MQQQRQERVLVVDDVESIRSFIRVALLNLGFSKVDTASSGYETLEKIDKEHYDFIILDINLPDYDGLELLTEVLVKSPGSRVVMCSGDSTKENIINAVSKGAVHFLAKPVTVSKLLNTLERMGLR